MMNRNPDILFMAEYIKNVLYFATVRQGKVLKNTVDAHYFCIDNELVYENYYSDFGPLNLGCVFKYCRILNDKLKLYLNKQIIVHYTAIEPKKKANSAFLLGCYGVLYLSLTPRDALKPLMVHGQNYRPFQDATQGDSAYTISLIDCLQAIKKARELGFFNFQDFNYEEYDRLDKIQGGDLNWIVPGKFLAFIGPVDYSVSLYHPPEMYIDYFLENNVKMVIRLNKRLYDGNVFGNVGIIHYDLFFPDGSCPPRHILFKFLQISEDAESAIAVHCKAGLGRTGSLIGCYLIKHYHMTSHEAIGWMRICRPGSVIGHQQGWLEQLEPWLLKQGNLYRKRTYQDTDKMPFHEFGVYSIAEKTRKQRPVPFQKTHSPPPSIQTHVRADSVAPVRPQASRIRDVSLTATLVATHFNYNETKKKQCYFNLFVLMIGDRHQIKCLVLHLDKSEEEVFLTSCDLTVVSTEPTTRMKGCVIKNNPITEEYDDHSESRSSIWQKYLCCQPCFDKLNDGLWFLAVRCASVAPDNCHSIILCGFIDLAVVNKATEKDNQCDWRVKGSNVNSSQKIIHKGEPLDTSSSASRRIGAGDPRAGRPLSRGSTARTQSQRNSAKSNESNAKSSNAYYPLTKFRSSQAPVIKSVNDAKNFLLQSSVYKDGREKQLNSTITITPHYSVRSPNYNDKFSGNETHLSPSSYSTATKSPGQPQNRRRLGRSPSPPQTRVVNEQHRATNTPTTAEKFILKDSSKSTLRDVLSRLKLSMCRDDSIGAASFGAASLGARREAPAPRRAPSVRSDERPLATQGDMLNSIKFQRRFRDTIHTEKSSTFHEKVSLVPKEKSSVKNVPTRCITPARPGISQDLSGARDKAHPIQRSFFGPTRPMSPKGRRSPQAGFY